MHWLQVCVILLLATALARSAKNSTNGMLFICILAVQDTELYNVLNVAALSQDGTAATGSDESGSSGNKLLSLWMPVMGGGIVVVAMVGICVLCAVYKIKKQRQSRSSPTYLGSCRRMNTIYSEWCTILQLCMHRSIHVCMCIIIIHVIGDYMIYTGSVNVGVQAMERAGIHRQQSSPHPAPHSTEYHHNQQHGEEEEEERMKDKRSLPSPGITLAPAGGVAARGLAPRYEGTVCRGRGGGKDSIYESYRNSLPVGSLSRTYTYPHLHTEREFSYCVVEENTEHHMMMTAISAPCLHTLFSEPFPVQEEREIMCQQPSVEAGRSATYMKLNLRTMEGTSDYEKLNKTGPTVAATSTARAGLQGSVVATNLSHGQRKRPPPLIASRGKVVHAALRELQSASSSDRGSAEEMVNGASTELLLQDTAAS